MNKIKILVAITKNIERRKRLRNTIEKTAYNSNSPVDIIFCNEADMPEFVDDCDVVLCAFFRKEVLNRARKVKWVHFASAGVDYALYPELIQSDIRITASKGINSINVAEHVFAFMLYFSRCIDKGIEYKKNRTWQKWELSVLTSTLRGKILGILGLGFIGQEIAKLGRAFGMEIYGMDIDEKRRIFTDRFFKPESLYDTLKEMDYIVLALPLTQGTVHILSKKELNILKSDCVLINVARGKLIDEEYLIKILKEGKIKGFGADVFYTEPLPENSPLFDLSNVVMTPHIAGNFEEYIDEVGVSFAENLKLFIDNQSLKNEVDKQSGF